MDLKYVNTLMLSIVDLFSTVRHFKINLSTLSSVSITNEDGISTGICYHGDNLHIFDNFSTKIQIFK